MTAGAVAGVTILAFFMFVLGVGCGLVIRVIWDETKKYKKIDKFLREKLTAEKYLQYLDACEYEKNYDLVVSILKDNLNKEDFNVYLSMKGIEVKD